MKPRHPNVEWIKKVLADLERDRSNPQIAALMDCGSDCGSDRGLDELAVTAPEPVCGLQPTQEPLDDPSCAPIDTAGAAGAPQVR